MSGIIGHTIYGVLALLYSSRKRVIAWFRIGSLLVGCGVLAGCGLVSDYLFAKYKREFVQKNRESLNLILDEQVVEIAAPVQKVAATMLESRAVKLFVPQYRSFETNSEDSIRLEYDSWFCLVHWPNEANQELDQLLHGMGAIPFERLCNFHRFSEREVLATRSQQEFARISSLAVARMVMQSTLSQQRFAEFQTPHLQGILSGSLAKGSMAVEFDCFSKMHSELPYVRIQVFRKNTMVNDEEIEAFLAAIQIQPAG